MRKAILNLLGFLAVLVLTVAAVNVLSVISENTDPVARYTEQVRREEVQVEEFSAPAQDKGLSFSQGMGAFGLIVAVAGGGYLLAVRGKRKGRGQRGRGYQPRKDTAHALRGRRQLRG